MNKKKILIINRDEKNNKEFKKEFETYGFSVNSISNPESNLTDRVMKINPALIILDINFEPEINIFELVKEIKNNLNIPIVYLCDKINRKLVSSLHDTMPYSYMLKPVDYSLLYSNVDAVLYRFEIEKRLLENEIKYRTLIEDTNDIVFSLDRMGIIVFISARIEDVIGYNINEIIGSSFLKFFSKADKAKVLDSFNEIKLGTVRPAEYGIVTKSGEELWIKTSYKPVFVEGKFFGVRGIITNISKEKKQKKL